VIYIAITVNGREYVVLVDGKVVAGRCKVSFRLPALKFRIRGI
jgi:hypothetical protein